MAVLNDHPERLLLWKWVGAMTAGWDQKPETEPAALEDEVGTADEGFMIFCVPHELELRAKRAEWASRFFFDDDAGHILAYLSAQNGILGINGTRQTMRNAGPDYRYTLRIRFDSVCPSIPKSHLADSL